MRTRSALHAADMAASKKRVDLSSEQLDHVRLSFPLKHFNIFRKTQPLESKSKSNMLVPLILSPGVWSEGRVHLVLLAVHDPTNQHLVLPSFHPFLRNNLAHHPPSSSPPQQSRHTPDMATASSSTAVPPASTSSAAAPEGPPITNQVLSIPHAQYPHFVTQIVHLRSNNGSSLFVHCTSISSSTARALLPTSTTDTAEEDGAIDAELHAALIAAGRANPSATAPGVSGSLAADFALAMSPPPHQSSSAGYKREPISTPISSTSAAAATSSLASAIAKRIALKLALPQLLLSLDLPPPLLPAPGRVQSPEDARALLALEKALRDACASALT